MIYFDCFEQMDVCFEMDRWGKIGWVGFDGKIMSELKR